MEITTVGIDLAKNVFQVHAIGGAGRSHRPASAKAGSGGALLPQACALPDRHGGLRQRAITGRASWPLWVIQVRLMPPAYVKPYVKRGKTDAADAEAICEAVTRPTMRFVPVKSVEQQAALALHRPATCSSASGRSSST